MIEILAISTVSDLYEHQRALRQAVLFSHLPASRERSVADRFDGESDAKHIVAVLSGDVNSRVVGCLSLCVDTTARFRAKLTRVAVDEGYRRRGIGRMLVLDAERCGLKEFGATVLFCHARRGSYGFYERLGWRMSSEPFTEDGIEHRLMTSPTLKT
jgi:predicted GNAT family N-acyltransferase